MHLHCWFVRPIEGGDSIRQPSSLVHGRNVTLTWLGHATVLIDFYGVRVLTDPTLFPRVGVDAWVTTLGMRRRIPCALKHSQLPPIDLVLISHAHFDHLDRRSLRKIPGRPAVITAWATSDLLPRRRRF